ncbi:MAG: radical SAM protein [Kiritimatiellae bacterium]|nr:radical SAM protein [Kiritimatiellia bacterium]
MSTVQVYETFTSIQGESTFSGVSCFFIRLTGCNLRCAYCDTTQAFEGGRQRFVGDLVSEAVASRSRIIEVTGGEPLLQEGFSDLAAALLAEVKRPLLVETNGSCDISLIPDGAVGVIDVKTPGSGECGSFDVANIDRLRAQDELKFVIGDHHDYEWSKQFVVKHGLNDRCHAVLFSPVAGTLAASDLAGWIVEDGAPVRLQLQLHRILGVL